MRTKELLLRTVLATLCVCVVCIAGGEIARAQQAGFVRFQMNDGHCTNGAGPQVSTAAGDNVWTVYEGDSDDWDPDCVRFYIGGSIPAHMDIRLCIQFNDDGGLFGIGGGTGSEECSGWASAGGGWSSWAYDNSDFWAIDRMRIRVDSQPMAESISNMRIGYQNSRATGKVCANGVGAIGYGSYMASGGGWGAYVPDALNEGSIACGRVRLDGVTLVPDPPVTTVWVRNTTTGSAETTSNITIGQSDEVSIRWSGTNSPASCTASANPADAAFSTGNSAAGTDTSVTEPTPGTTRTYIVTCSNAGGSDSEQVIVTRPVPPPVTSVYITKTGAAETANNSINLAAGEFVTNIRWSSLDATACIASANPADGAFTGAITAPSGDDSSVTSPAPANTTVYTVTCSNASGSHPDSVVVTKDPLPPVPTLWVTPSNGSETTANVTIGPSDTVSLRWSATNAPTSCTASASPADSLFTGSIAVPGGTDNDVTEPAVGNTTTYTVTCTNAGGSLSDSISVDRVNPPVTTVWVTPSLGSETTNNVTIGPSETISLRWSGTNSPTSCTASANPADGAFTGGVATPGGVDADVTEPAVGNTTTFTVLCANGGGSTSDTIVVTRAGAPTAVLEARNTTTGTGWVTTSPFNITAGDQIEFQWSSTNAVNGCTKTFIAGTATSGNAPTITEPAASTSASFSLVCTGAGGTTPASRTTIVNSYPAIPFLAVSRRDVRAGETIMIAWDTYLNTPSQCSITGPDAPGTLSLQNGSFNAAIQGTSTFTITCPGGSTSITVRIVPMVIET